MDVSQYGKSAFSGKESALFDAHYEIKKLPFYLFFGVALTLYIQAIKSELINDSDFKDIYQAQIEIFKYFETYYNTKRIHSSINYQLPREFEKNNH